MVGSMLDPTGRANSNGTAEGTAAMSSAHRGDRIFGAHRDQTAGTTAT
jgi:hypothetical protein